MVYHCSSCGRFAIFYDGDQCPTCGNYSRLDLKSQFPGLSLGSGRTPPPEKGTGVPNPGAGPLLGQQPESGSNLHTHANRNQFNPPLPVEQQPSAQNSMPPGEVDVDEMIAELFRLCRMEDAEVEVEPTETAHLPPVDSKQSTRPKKPKSESTVSDMDEVFDTVEFPTLFTKTRGTQNHAATLNELVRENDWYSFTDEVRGQLAEKLQPVLATIAKVRAEAQCRAVRRAVKYRASDLPKLSSDTDAVMTDKSKQIHLVSCDTIMGVQIARNAWNPEPIAALNFADHRTPGGKLFQGASTQEEHLCNCTTLYVTIKDVTAEDVEMEGNNLANPKSSFYPLLPGELLYSKDVTVMNSPIPDAIRADQKEFFEIGVISCPAAERKKDSTGKRLAYNDKARDDMRNRMRLILRAACKHEVKVIVVGAIGCGIFGHPVDEVATAWREVLLDQEEVWRKHGIEHVIIAIKDMATDLGKGYATWQGFMKAFEGSLDQGVRIDRSGIWKVKMSTMTVYDRTSDD